VRLAEQKPFARTRRHGPLDAALLILLVTGCYVIGMTTLIPIGEETRRARGAINMIESGDWIVVRQQGIVFADRPPLTNWLIAWTGLLRGEVDRIAIRVPSAVATVLTTLLIYGYGRRVASRFAGLAAGFVYATFGQVLQLGGLGESEAVFTLLIAASLLLWHLGYSSGWPPVVTWCVGYSCAALAALTKGAQAPIYFVAATGVFLVIRRQWRRLLGWPQWAGLATFGLILAAWQVPYYRRTDWRSVVDTWFAVVGPRIVPEDLLVHVVTYPLETFVSLAPWSLLLLLALDPGTRATLPDDRSQTTFLLVSILVCYPTVWFAPGAVGRYFMPLYPCIAILIGMILEASSNAPWNSPARRGWRTFLLAGAGFTITCGTLLLLATFGSFESLQRFRQRPAFGLAYMLVAFVAAGAFLSAQRRKGARFSLLAIGLLAGFLGLTYNGAVRHVRIREWYDMGPAVRAVRERIPDPASLVSFGPLPHGFNYYYGEPIPELPWPREIADLPAGTEYFSFNCAPTDVDEIVMQRGMKIWSVPSRLPFLWEEVGRVPWGRTNADDPQSWAIVGRVLHGPDGAVLPARP